MAPNRYRTTHQVAKLLGVSLPTVVNWVEKGLIDAHRTPGGHRRICPNSLARFARNNNYPIVGGDLFSSVERRRVLIIDDDRNSSDTVSEYLALKGNIQSALAEGPVEAGFQLSRFSPEVVLLRMQIGGINCLALGQRLIDLARPHPLRVVAWSDFHDPNLERRARDAGFVSFLTKPTKLNVMLNEIQNNLVD